MGAENALLNQLTTFDVRIVIWQPGMLQSSSNQLLLRLPTKIAP